MGDSLSRLVRPHGGGELEPLLIGAAGRDGALMRADGLKKVPMTSRETSDLVMMAMGAYTPLTGFMGEADWRGVCQDMKMADGLFWPIPITLSAEKDCGVAVADEVALVDGDSGEIMAIMTVREIYAIDKRFECGGVYGTTSTDHPGVHTVMEQGAVNLAGPVTALSEGVCPELYPRLFLRPAESRTLFAEKGWSRVVALQTRNPMHRSHEYLAKIAIEVADGVFIHQVLGKLKPGDIPAAVRVKAIDVMIDNYFVPGTAVQAGYPIEMRYAGPREALLHALLRQNFGCSHLIVGRDHAGVGDTYGPFDAQHIFDTLWEGALETKALKIDITFYCTKCLGMATGRTCPHGAEDRVLISGTRQREMLSAGEDIPPEFSRPEVVAVLKEYYASLK